MALKPTIYKLKIELADTNRERYETLNLTVAQHPSETLERMMVRVLAYSLHAEENLQFTKGLSEPDIPDIEARSLDGVLQSWIDVGEPSVDRIKKASTVSKSVTVYSFNSKSDTWWKIEKPALLNTGAVFFQIPWPSAQAMAALVQRTMDLSVAVSEDIVYVSSADKNCEITLKALN